MPNVYTIGYEGCEPNQFVEKLIIHGVKTLIDVRERPLSRKNGFRKSVLYSYLKKYGIRYYHLGELGSPSKIRYKLYEDQNYESFFTKYASYLRKQTAALKQLAKIIGTNPSCCIMCFENDYQLCHRKVLAEHLSALRFNVRHI